MRRPVGVLHGAVCPRARRAVLGRRVLRRRVPPARRDGDVRRVGPLHAAAAFVIGGMVLGAALAWGGQSLPGVETGITFSVLVAGILIATLAKLPTAVGGTLVGAFMLFHGFAHGAEMPEGATLAAYLAGFSIATLAITLVGRGLGSLMLKADSRFSRGIGGVLAVAGAYLAAA